MQHVHDATTGDEVAELVACTLDRFARIDEQLAEIPVLRQRLADAEEALAQRADAMCALSSAFDGVCLALNRLTADS